MIRSLRQLSLLLVLSSLLIAGCGGSSEENLEAENGDKATDTVSSVDAISSGTVTASSLNIHEAPGTDTPILYGAPAGTEVDIFDETALGDSVWYQIRARSETLPSDLGWAFSRYIDTGEGSGQGAAQPGTPNPGNGSGGAGGLDPEAPGANPDTPGMVDPEAPGANPDTPGMVGPEALGANHDTPGMVGPEAPGANPDTPGMVDPEAPGANPDTPGMVDPEAPGANPDNSGGSDG